LVTARGIVFLSVMAAIGLFVLRLAIARPVVRRVPGTRLRAVSIAFGVAVVLGLIATPVYVVMATAEFALRSSFDLGNVLPLVRHAAQTSPRGLSVALDWLHLVAGSLWIGGLIGLLVLWWSLPATRRVAGLT